MEDYRVLAFLKFGEQQFVDSFLSGLLYMNPLSYFVSLEQRQARQDPREGEEFWLQSKNARLSVEINGEYREIPNLCGPISYRHPKNLKTNVFCMRALRSDRMNQRELIDERNLNQFGSCFALILFGDEFLRRVRAAVQNLDLELIWGLVEYIDEGTYQGPVGVFRKTTKFAYQSEFRMVIQPGSGEPLRLGVGDIRDIAISGPTTELNQILRIESIEGRPRLLCATEQYRALAARTS